MERRPKTPPKTLQNSLIGRLFIINGLTFSSEKLVSGLLFGGRSNASSTHTKKKTPATVAAGFGLVWLILDYNGWLRTYILLSSPSLLSFLPSFLIKGSVSVSIPLASRQRNRQRAYLTGHQRPTIPYIYTTGGVHRKLASIPWDDVSNPKWL